MSVYIGYRVCFLFYERSTFVDAFNPSTNPNKWYGDFDMGGAISGGNRLQRISDLESQKAVLLAREKLMKKNFKVVSHYLIGFDKGKTFYLVSFRGPCLKYDVSYTIFSKEVYKRGDDCPPDETIEIDMEEVRKFQRAEEL